MAEKRDSMKQMIIVGGGAAGMMTAIHAAENYKVLLLEKNDKLGKKLFITGKGRCNLTNACDEETFLRNVMSNPKFLFSAIAAYTPQDVMDSFESWGLKLKTERGNRVFPASDHSSDVIRTLEQEMKRRGVEVRLSAHVTAVSPIFASAATKNDVQNMDDEKGIDYPADGMNGDDSVSEQQITGWTVRLSDRSTLQADVVVLATGGISYPGTGASGEGMEFLKALDLTVRPFQPSLVPFTSDISLCKPMMGLSLKNVEASVYRLSKPKKPVYKEFGEMLFTHFGVSGPLILSASGLLQKYFTPEGLPKEDLELRIDWKPALTAEQLDQRVLRDFEKAKNKTAVHAVEELLPRLAIPVILSAAGIPEDRRVHDITQEERRRLVETLKAFRLPVTGLRGFDEAIISAGGLSVKEIDPRTMEVKRFPGLRVAGEMMDLDALTGGFNLQIAWCTAKLAAQ